MWLPEKYCPMSKIAGVVAPIRFITLTSPAKPNIGMWAGMLESGLTECPEACAERYPHFEEVSRDM